MSVSVKDMAVAARPAAQELAISDTDLKNKSLLAIAKSLKANQASILEANEKDLAVAKQSDVPAALLDRLMLDEGRINAICEALEDLVKLEDPVGEEIDSWQLESGVQLVKKRVPFGVIGIIFEARPNVAVDAAALCIKTGNAVILKGSSHALSTNIELVKSMQEALTSVGVNPDSIQLIANASRESAQELLHLNGLVDVIIPRGGASLINYVVNHSSVPVIETGAGNCHLYIDQKANLEMAIEIAINAKTDRPSVCNAIETLLWHKDLDGEFIKKIIQELMLAGVECRGCIETRKVFPELTLAGEEDWQTEFLDYVIAIKQVENTEEAINHINTYGTKHSEAIVTEEQAEADKFLAQVDAAAVYWNASTRFTDGGVFGFGAEIGISTQKLHARGPMGLKEMTSYKYLLLGNGQIR